MRSMTFRLALVATVAMTLSSAVAHAETPDPAAAETLFRQGRAWVEAGDYPHACTAFAESLRLDPAPGTLLNLADCEEHIGRLASARGHFLRVESVLPATDERRAIAHDRAGMLDARIPRLTITLGPEAPRDARVFRDDVEVDRLQPCRPAARRSRGAWRARRGVRRESKSVAVVALEREAVHIVVSPGPVVAHDVLVPPPSPPPAPTHTAAWVIGAGAIASFGVGTYFGGRALAERTISDAGCTRGACSCGRAERLRLRALRRSRGGRGARHRGGRARGRRVPAPHVGQRRPGAVGPSGVDGSGLRGHVVSRRLGKGGRAARVARDPGGLRGSSWTTGRGCWYPPTDTGADAGNPARRRSGDEARRRAVRRGARRVAPPDVAPPPDAGPGPGLRLALHRPP